MPGPLHRQFLRLGYATAALTTLLCVAPVSLAQGAKAREPLSLRQGQHSYPLGQVVQVLEDPESRWTFDDISRPPLSDRFVPIQQDVPSFGFKPSAYWFRIKLHSQLNSRQKMLLEVAYPMLDSIEVHIEQQGREPLEMTAGDLYPGGNKIIRHSSFLFPFTVDPGQQLILYLRVQSQGAVLVPLILWTPEGLRDHENEIRIIHGLYYGFLVVMIFYNLFLFIATRDRTILWFVIYACSATAFLSSNDGLAQEYLWPNIPWWANRVIPFSLFCASFVGLLTTRNLLDLEDHLPRWDRILSVAILLGMGGTVASLVVPYNPLIITAVVWVGISIFLSAIATLLAWRKGNQLARYYLLAAAVLILGAIIVSFERIALIPRSTLTDNALAFGFGFNILFSSITIADRINFIRRESERAQADLELAYEQLAEHDRLKSTFFANVSHELRTPLTLILTPIERLLAGTWGMLSDEINERLRTMRDNTRRLLLLVNQLLDFSRIESGATTVIYERRDVRALVEPIVATFKQFARSKGIQLELRGPTRLPTAYVDVNKLEKAVSNLLSNACKFTERGGQIVVRLEQIDGALRLTVKDTGIGISEGDRAMIFERFHQVDSSTARRHQGPGIGLALTKELIEMSGGTIEVESELGIGSILTITLPLGDNHISDPARIRIRPPDGGSPEDHAGETASALATTEGMSSHPSPRDHTEQRADTSKPLLVLVEDNPDMCALVKEICHNDFYVLEARDGPTGLELIKKRLPSLVISEVMLSGMDGHELLRSVRSDPATESIPLILLTTETEMEQRIEGLESGADDYLNKPFESRELLARAKNLVRLQQQEIELRQLHETLQHQVVSQAAEIAQAKTLERFLPADVARAVMEDDSRAMVRQKLEQLTVFRLELVGFDRMIMTLDPEDLAALFNTYLSEIMDTAFEYGATVDKFIRDTVVGFFGAPRSKGAAEDALRCARMANAIWRRAVDICARWRQMISIQPPMPTAVLCTGHAIVGTFGSSNRLEYTAVGGPIEQTKQIMPAVAAGEVVCAQSTWELIQGACEGEARGESMGLKLYRLAGPPDPVSEAADLQTQRRPYDETAGVAHTGTQISDRYRIIRLLGEGTGGTSYLVHDLKLDVDVALKLLPSESLPEDRTGVWFYREAKMARLIRHTNVARIYDISEWEGQEMVTMEYVRGQSLRDRLRADGALHLKEGLAVMRQLCAGLGAAHAAGVLHRNLNPKNIILQADGRVVILDLGLAGMTSFHQLGRSNPQIELEERCYLAPEQIDSDEIDFRADIYALGAVSYELFAGDRPPAGDPVKSRLETLRLDLPPRLIAVILRCLAASPQDRFRTTAEINALIERMS